MNGEWNQEPAPESFFEFCEWAIARGHRVEITPQAFHLAMRTPAREAKFRKAFAARGWRLLWLEELGYHLLSVRPQPLPPPTPAQEARWANWQPDPNPIPRSFFMPQRQTGRWEY